MDDGLVWTNPHEFVSGVQKFALLSGRSFEDELVNQVRLGFLKVVKITPPSSGLKSGAAAAKKAGLGAISNDMGRVMAPVNLKGSRTITQLFGKPAENFGGPWTVPTVEKTPNVAGYYKPFFKNGRRPRGGRGKAAVSRVKYNREKKRRQKMTGFLAGGFGPTAIGLGAKLPAYARRHLMAVPGARKQTIDRSGDGVVITLENNVKYASKLGMQKRLNWAMQVQMNSMERQIPYLQRKAAKATGFA